MEDNGLWLLAKVILQVCGLVVILIVIGYLADKYAK